MVYRKLAVLFALWSVQTAAVPIIGDPADLPNIDFDFIVVGGAHPNFETEILLFSSTPQAEQRAM